MNRRYTLSDPDCNRRYILFRPLKQYVIYSIVLRMGRKQINGEQYLARFPVGTLEAIAAVLEEKEGVAAFIRTAIERELKRRERRAK